LKANLTERAMLCEGTERAKLKGRLRNLTLCGFDWFAAMRSDGSTAFTQRLQIEQGSNAYSR
jgi:hypothetical protein